MNGGCCHGVAGPYEYGGELFQVWWCSRARPPAGHLTPGSQCRRRMVTEAHAAAGTVRAYSTSGRLLVHHHRHSGRLVSHSPTVSI
jgi:hypothetical protein